MTEANVGKLGRNVSPSYSTLSPYDTVRVVVLRDSPESHLAISGCARPPAIGDVGTIVDLISIEKADAVRFIVESYEGSDFVWLAEFSHEELELVSRALSTTPENAKVTRDTLENLRAECLASMTAHDIHRVYVEKHDVLPLTSDMGGFYGLTMTGDLLAFEWDGKELGTLLTDPRLVNVALFQGARKYPALQPLLPKRPHDAQACDTCDGTGRITTLPPHLREKIVCYCGGAGWLPQSTTKLRREGSTKRWWKFWRA